MFFPFVFYRKHDKVAPIAMNTITQYKSSVERDTSLNIYSPTSILNPKCRSSVNPDNSSHSSDEYSILLNKSKNNSGCIIS